MKNHTTVTLKDIAEITAGQSAPQGDECFSDNGTPFVRAGSLDALLNGKTEDDLEHIEESVAKDHRLRLFPKDTVLFAKSGMSAKLGRIYRLRKPAYVVSHLAAILPKASLESRYLQRWLEHSPPSRLIPNDSYPSIGLSEISKLEVSLPALPEQRRIADILDKADAIRRKRQESNDLIKDVLKSAYLEFFGNPRRNSMAWNVDVLGEVCSVDRGKFTPRPRNDPRFYDGPYPFIQTGDISSSGGLLSKWKQTLNDEGVAVSRSFGPGTVVIAIVGATIGETAILARKMYCPDSVIGIVPRQDKVTSEYIEFTLRFFKQHFRDMAPETARANINLDTLRPLEIPIPPMPLQQQFSRMFQKCYAMKKNVVDPKDETEDLFNSLVQTAFRGEL
jgi:type I restriction enzyme S subunit